MKETPYLRRATLPSALGAHRTLSPAPPPAKVSQTVHPTGYWSLCPLPPSTPAPCLAPSQAALKLDVACQTHPQSACARCRRRLRLGPLLPSSCCAVSGWAPGACAGLSGHDQVQDAGFPWLWVSRARPWVCVGCQLSERTWPPLPQADLNLAHAAPSLLCRNPTGSSHLCARLRCSLRGTSSLHWPGCLLLIPQASDQLALLREAFTGLGAEPASPALPLPLCSPGTLCGARPGPLPHGGRAWAGSSGDREPRGSGQWAQGGLAVGWSGPKLPGESGSSTWPRLSPSSCRQTADQHECPPAHRARAEPG